MKTFLIVLAVLLMISGVAISFYFFSILSHHYTIGQDSAVILMEETGQSADFIGGVVGTIFSLAGTILLLITLNTQIRDNFVSSFESKFFKLIELHRANIDEVSLKRSTTPGGEVQPVEKRRAFKIVFDNIIECRDEISPFLNQLTPDKIYTKQYQDYLTAQLKLIGRNINLSQLAIIDIAYCIVFFGIDKRGSPILEKLFENKYKHDLIISTLDYIKLKPVYHSKFWNKWSNLASKPYNEKISAIERIKELRLVDRDEAFKNDLFYPDEYVKYYGGNQYWLGHYYRHLFQTVKFVNNYKGLSFEEKYFYVKTLRAQLSTYEQALLLVNSLSAPGLIWEYIPEYKTAKFEFMNGKRRANSMLITKYNLIKNLPGESLSDIRYKEYYPKVEFEIDRLMIISNDK